MQVGDAAKEYASRLKTLLPKFARNNLSSVDGLLSRPSALLAEGLKRSLILITIADDSSQESLSNLPSNLPGSLLRRNINENSLVEQGSQTRRISAKTLEHLDAMALNNSTSETDYKKDPRNATHPDLSCDVTGFATKTHGFESSLFSTNSRVLPEKGLWVLQGNPQRYDDQLRSAGNALALAYNNNSGDLKAQGFLSAWICNLALAGEEHSVSNLESLPH